MNIYRQLAENVRNPRVQSGADIQRMLDMMDRFQSGPITSNINSAMQERYGGESAPQGPAMQGQMSDDPNSMATLGYSFGLPSGLVSSIFGQQGLQAAQQAFPSPTTTVGKGISKLGSPAMNFFTGIPSFFSNLGMRQFVNPLISFLEGQLGFGKGQNQFGQQFSPDQFGMMDFGMDTPGSFSPSFSMDQFGMMDFGMDQQGIGQTGNMGLAEAMGMLGMGMEGFGGSVGDGDSNGGIGMGMGMGDGMGMY